MHDVRCGLRLWTRLILVVWIATYFLGNLVLYLFPKANAGTLGEGLYSGGRAQRSVETHLDQHSWSTVDLPALLRTRAQENIIVLIGFNYGYKDMFLNLLCQLHHLNLSNYVAAAFDVQAYSFCLENGLPCFPTVSEGAAWDDAASFEVLNTSLPQIWSTDGFKKMTKQKSRQALRVLELGYDVLWTDVDVFWKRNPLEDISRQLSSSGAHILIQSDALWNLDANSCVNSGFYFMKRSQRTIDVLGDIIADSRKSNESEQPSFNRVLCEERIGWNECRSRRGAITQVLDPKRYVHGASYHIIKDVTRESEDDVIMVHFNYRAGLQDKKAALEENGLWLLDNDCYPVDSKLDRTRK